MQNSKLELIIWWPEFFNGSIDDIRIYNRALSAEEIRLLYEVEVELPTGSVTSAKLSPALSDLIDGNGSLEQALPPVRSSPANPATPPRLYLFQRKNIMPPLSGKRRLQ